MNFAKFLVFVVITLASLPAQAIYPRGKVKFHNAKLVSHKKEALGKAWLNFIDDYPEILKQKDKDYKIDQHCSFEIQANEHGELKLESIKLAKHENNFDYNLKAIQFLRETPIRVEQKDLEEPIGLELIYYSF